MESSQRIHEQSQDAVLLREIHLAKNIQQRLLNGAKPLLSNGAISGISLPARIIGGDYFDFYPLPDGRLRLIIGDVMGKGIPAAMLMILTRGAFRSAAESTAGPGETLTAMNNALYGDLRTLNSFVTVCCADWDPSSGQFIYANGGHNAPILVRTDTEATELPTLNGIMLGGLPGQAYDEKEIHLKASDLLFFYTDGVVEAQNRASEMYNLERLLSLLHSHADKPIAEIENTVVRTLEEYTEGLPQRDDITIVMLKMGNHLGEDLSDTAP
ncbi:PP2C family protein-serine/threonine phosphatase [Paenibacillus barcinonensis]|nr:PP2C family protein-serine/threonine phosphatase [Paenibacillus barcinonensis]